jgi:hypothetical protein
MAEHEKRVLGVSATGCDVAGNGCFSGQTDVLCQRVVTREQNVEVSGTFYRGNAIRRRGALIHLYLSLMLRTRQSD